MHRRALTSAKISRCAAQYPANAGMRLPLRGRKAVAALAILIMSVRTANATIKASLSAVIC